MDIRVPTRHTVASTGQRSRRLALIGAAALLIAACLTGHPARFIFASICTLLVPAPAMEGSGGHLLHIGPGNEITARETAVPQVLEMPEATELFGECGSNQAGPGGEPTGGTRHHPARSDIAASAL